MGPGDSEVGEIEFADRPDVNREGKKEGRFAKLDGHCTSDCHCGARFPPLIYRNDSHLFYLKTKGHQLNSNVQIIFVNLGLNITIIFIFFFALSLTSRLCCFFLF